MGGGFDRSAQHLFTSDGSSIDNCNVIWKSEGECTNQFCTNYDRPVNLLDEVEWSDEDPDSDV